MAYSVIRNTFRQTGSQTLRFTTAKDQQKSSMGRRRQSLRLGDEIGTANMLRAGAGGSFSSKTSRPILGVTKSPIQWVLKSFPGK